MYIVDTDVLSLTSPVNVSGTGDISAWRRWAQTHTDVLFLSSITIFEISYGVAKARARARGRKAITLELWLNDVLALFDDRIVDPAPEAAVLAGQMLWEAEECGFAPSSEDALIAASAKARGWTVLTRNGKDYAALGALWRDPLVAPID